MTACNHDTCPHGHWANHRHCSVEGCDYAEKRGSRMGDFVNGKFVCPDHAKSAETAPRGGAMDIFDALEKCMAGARGSREIFFTGVAFGAFGARLSQAEIFKTLSEMQDDAYRRGWEDRRDADRA